MGISDIALCTQRLHKVVWFGVLESNFFRIKFQTTNPLLVCNELMTHLEMNFDRKNLSPKRWARKGIIATCLIMWSLEASESFSHSQTPTIRRPFVHQSLELTAWQSRLICRSLQPAVMLPPVMFRLILWSSMESMTA